MQVLETEYNKPTSVTVEYHNIAAFGPTPRACLGWAEIDSIIFGYTTNPYVNQ